jgi:sugar transferase (PEP-CTERM/EpsH1 system associated)
MRRVLFLVHRIPFPPDKGDKIRSYHILRFLSARHRVYLGAFVDTPTDMAHRPHLEKYCETVFLRTIGGWRSRINALFGLFSGEALGLGYYKDGKMLAWVRALVQAEKIDAVLIFSSTMAQYALHASLPEIPIIADFCDVDSDKWRQHARKASLPISLVYQYEADALARWERRVAGSVGAVSLVSEAERDLLQSVLAGRSARIEVINNGVDVEFFDPGLEYERPYPDGVRVVVFTGAMDYYANEDAVVYNSERGLPQMRGLDK